MEIEAKFAIPNRQIYRELTRERELAGYRVEPIGIIRVADAYYDTPDGRLLAAGYACRIRSSDQGIVATLKGTGNAGGAIHRRDEQEVILPSMTSEATGWPESPARSLAIQLAAGQPLDMLFELTQERARAQIMDGERYVAELSLDAVRVQVGKRPALYYELEAELTPTGTEEDLTVIANTLSESWHLTPETRSKFQRAIARLRERGTAVEDRLSDEERAALEAIANGDEADRAKRAAVVLGWADGLQTKEICEHAGLSDGRVRFWLRAFRRDRLGIFDEPTKRTAPSEESADADVELTEEVDAQETVPRRSEAPKEEMPGRSRSSKAKDGPPSVVAFARQHGVNMEHARFVAAHARELFDELRPVHKLPRKRRRLLRLAAYMNTVGLLADPDRPHKAGRDLVLMQPLKGISTTERLALATIVAFNRSKIRPERENTMMALDQKLREHVLALSAILHVAEALDTSHTQTTEIRAIDGLGNETCEIRVRGAAADIDANHAAAEAVFWYRLYKQDLAFVVERPIPAGVAAKPTAPDSGSSMPDEEGLPEVPPLDPTEPMSEAGRKVLFIHFSRMLANEQGTREGTDIEALHDMRVATRRMRAAFQLFAPYFEQAAIRQFGRDLRKAGRTLGAVRDLDVLLDKARDFQATATPSIAGSMELLLTHWSTLREVARRNMLEYLDGKNYRTFVTQFREFLTTPGAGALQSDALFPAREQVRHVVPSLIMQRYESARAYEAVLPGAPLPVYHQLRIDCKRLRYVMEFFRELLGDDSRDLIKEITAMQDLLGSLQDARIAEGLIGEFLDAQRKKKSHPEQPDYNGVEAYLMSQQTAQQELLNQFPAPWEALVSVAFRQRLGEAIAVL